MIKKINKTEALFAKLKEEGKIKVLNSDMHLKETLFLNTELEEVRRTYKAKDKSSQYSAAMTILTR